MYLSWSVLKSEGFHQQPPPSPPLLLVGILLTHLLAIFLKDDSINRENRSCTSCALRVSGNYCPHVWHAQQMNKTSAMQYSHSFLWNSICPQKNTDGGWTRWNMNSPVSFTSQGKMAQHFVSHGDAWVRWMHCSLLWVMCKNEGVIFSVEKQWRLAILHIVTQFYRYFWYMLKFLHYTFHTRHNYVI